MGHTSDRIMAGAVTAAFTAGAAAVLVSAGATPATHTDSHVTAGHPACAIATPLGAHHLVSLVCCL
jgi:hypothetical protein